MLSIEAKQCFFDDYYKACLLRRAYVRLYKEVFRFESTLHKFEIQLIDPDGVKQFVKHTEDNGYKIQYDQEGFDKNHNQLTVDVIFDEYSDFDVNKLVFNIDDEDVEERTRKKLTKSLNNILKQISIIREVEMEMSPYYKSYIESVVEKHKTINVLDAKYPHYHWLYACLKKDLSPNDRMDYYTDQIYGNNIHGSEIFFSQKFPKIYRQPGEGSFNLADIDDENWSGYKEMAISMMIKYAEDVLQVYGETDIIPEKQKKIVFFTGSGISQESGIPTYYDLDESPWLGFPIKRVSYLSGWLANPLFVNKSFNKIRGEYFNRSVKPNKAHKLIAYINNKDYGEDIKDVLVENVVKPKPNGSAFYGVGDFDTDIPKVEDVTSYDVEDYPFDDFKSVVITQNLDTLHEQADLSKTLEIIHIHGQIDQMCLDNNQDNKDFWVTYTDKGWVNNIDGEIMYETTGKATDFDANMTVGNYINDNGKYPFKDHMLFDKLKNKRFRPNVIFYEEYVPKFGRSLYEMLTASVVVIIGNSLRVNPAATLIDYIPYGTPIFYIDPDPQYLDRDAIYIEKRATEGIIELLEQLQTDLRYFLE